MRWVIYTKALFIWIGMIAIVPALHGQKIIYVNQVATGENDGSSWENAYTDLQEAIDASSENDHLWIAGGTYYPTETNDREATFRIKSGQKWYGSFVGFESNPELRTIAQNPTILSGNIGSRESKLDNSFTVLTAIDTDTTTLMDGFNIVEGYASGGFNVMPQNPKVSGGGVHILVKDVAVGGVKFDQVSFRRNYARSYGGAMTITADEDSKTIIDMDICFFISNETRGLGNMFYVDRLSEERPHKIADVQARSGDVRSTTSEMYIKLSGDRQRLNFISNIMGKYLKRSDNTYLTIDNTAKETIFYAWDNQLFESDFTKAFDFRHSGEKLHIDFVANYFLDLAFTSSTAGELFSFTKEGNGEISFHLEENEFRRNIVSKLLAADNIDEVSVISNLFIRNDFRKVALDHYLAPDINQNCIIGNNIFSFNQGPIAAFSATKNQIKSSVFVHNTLYQNKRALYVDSGYLGTNWSGFLYFSGEDSTPYEVHNSIFYTLEDNAPIIYTKNVYLDFHNNSVQTNDCALTFEIDDNLDLECTKNVFTLDPVFINDNGRDMQLAFCSPCIDRGNDIWQIYPKINYDYKNQKSRPLGNQADIGAIEHENLLEENALLCHQVGENIVIPDFGIRPYQYAWINTENESGNQINSLPAGRYDLTITDQINCQRRVDLVISDPGNFNFKEENIRSTMQFCNGDTLDLSVPSWYDITWHDGRSDPSRLFTQTIDDQITVTDKCLEEEYPLRISYLGTSYLEIDTVLCGDDVLQLSEAIISNPGIYQDTIRYDAGCDSLIITYHIQRGEREEVSWSGDSLVCPDEAANIKIEGGAQYYWPDQSDTPEKLLLPGQYKVTITDKNGCTQHLPISITSYPTANWVLPSTVNKPATQALAIGLDTLVGITEFLTISPSAFAKVNASDEVTVTNTNDQLFILEISYGDGCISYDSILVTTTFDPSTLVTVSNIMDTKGGAGFTIHTDNLVQTLSLKVYDRWGSLVFTKDLDNQSGLLRNVWNPSENSYHLPSGVYTYLIKVRFDSRDFWISGDVTLLR